MATGRKGSTSKAGGVRFPDDDEPPGSPTRRDDQSNLSTLIAIPEKDGSYLVKAGFLKSHHCYEIVFTVPDVPTLGKELSCLPCSSPTRRSSSLRVHRVNSTMEGGVKVTCEYRTHQEGVLHEEITLVTKGRKDSSLKVRLQARVIDPHHGTPMLLEGVRCLGAQKDAHTKHSSDHITKHRTESLHDDLMNGMIRSNRMFLWQNPSTSINLKQHLKLRTLNFSDQRILELLRVIEEVTGVGAQIKRGEIRLLDFVFDVMLPEKLIKILEEEGMTRLQAEIMMASGSLI